MYKDYPAAYQVSKGAALQVIRFFTSAYAPICSSAR